MEDYVVLLYLILGLILALIVTRWFNWLAWGQRRDRKNTEQERRRARINDGHGRDR